MKNRNILTLTVALIFFTINVDAENYTNCAFKLDLEQEKDSVAVLISSAYTTNIKQLELSGLASKNANGKTKDLAKNLRDYFIKTNAEIRKFASQKKITLPMTKPQGGMRPDGRVDSAPENLKDTSRNESGAGEAGNTGIKDESKVKPEVTQSVLSLSKLKGTAFNKAYLNALSTDLTQLISLYGKILESNDAALKAFAKNELSQLTHFSDQLK